ncbi:6748_t:CDS:2 [Entrophospora sp. SA101]|nr:6748_t:CDS:2 [Entrophospora sp. SA101]
MNVISEQINKTLAKYNQELAKNNQISEDNIIDFSQEKNKEKELVENKIKEINIDKIVNKSPLQKSLLAIFDPSQNANLFIKGTNIYLSQFVLIATSSTQDTEEETPRLSLINSLRSSIEKYERGEDVNVSNINSFRKIENDILCSHKKSEENKPHNSKNFEWECDYCGVVINSKKDNETRSYYQYESFLVSLIEEHLNKCKEAQKILDFVEANKVENLSYDNTNSLQEKGYYPKLTVEQIIKGYQSQVVKQIKSWGLINKVNLPNLKEKTRIGVVNTLSVDYSKRIVDKNDLTGRYTTVSGNSATMAFYLALLSCYYQKPISREENELAKNMEKIFSQNEIKQVGGLEYKIPVAIESGVKKLILSVEQKKDYEKNVPQEIREKLTVYYVKNVEELEELFFRGEFS